MEIHVNIDNQSVSLYCRCMDPRERAETILEETEQSLRELMEEALSAGDYLSLSVVARWADRIKEITPMGQIATASSVAPSVPREGTGVAYPVPPQTEKRAGAPFPRFEVDSDQLVKIGWSKTNNGVYEQRAPAKVRDILVGSLVHLSKVKRRFTTEDLFPLTDPDDGTEIPSYQSYLCLAWLREIGLVRKHGRAGYSVVSWEDPRDLVEGRWSQLPNRSGRPSPDGEE